MIFKKKKLCNAPFANIYIDSKGNITPCCFNRTDIFGNIYQQEIEEIWNSTTAFNLRNEISGGNLPEGCKICKDSLNSGNYYNSGIATFQHLKPNNIIQSIDFELSYFCNFQCKMCYLNSKTYDLDNEQEDLLIKKLLPLFKQINYARFYGGEPLIIPIYKKIWKEIIAINSKCNIIIQTNGSIINQEIQELAPKGNFTFNISIDTIKPENYKLIRINGNLEKILKNLTIFKNISKNAITIAITPMTLNAYDIPELIAFCNKNNFHIFINYLIFPFKYSLNSLNKQNLTKLFNFYKSFNFLPKSYTQLQNLIKWKQYLKQLHYRLSILTNYNDNELDSITIELYNYYLNKYTWLNQYPDLIIKQIFKKLLLDKSKDKLIYEINNLPSEKLKNHIEHLLKEF